MAKRKSFKRKHTELVQVVRNLLKKLDRINFNNVGHCNSEAIHDLRKILHSMVRKRTPKIKECYFDYDFIDELGEIGEGEQLALVWCESHEAYEWTTIPYEK